MIHSWSERMLSGWCVSHRLPWAVRYSEQIGAEILYQACIIYPHLQVIGGIYLAAFESGSFGSPAALPRQLSRLCAPNPATADNEACSSVSACHSRHWLVVVLAGLRHLLRKLGKHIALD